MEVSTDPQPHEPEWYVLVGGATYGPYAQIWLRAECEAGRIAPEGLAAIVGDQHWTKISDCSALVPPARRAVPPPLPPPIPPPLYAPPYSAPAPPYLILRIPVPGPIVFAAVLSFVWAGIFGIVVLAQMAMVLSGSGSSTALLAMWNALIVVVYGFIGAGLWKGERKAYEWGVGSNALNIAFGLYQLLESGVVLHVFLIPIEIAILVILVLHREYFPAPAKPARVVIPGKP